jgi:hypothetical protein
MIVRVASSLTMHESPTHVEVRMLQQTTKLTTEHAPATKRSRDALPVSMIEQLDHPQDDRPARCAFETSMVWELVRRFGDHRVLDNATTRSWVLHVVRKHYWRIWSYLIIASLIWGIAVHAFFVLTVAVIKPDLTGVGRLFLTFLCVMTVSPIFNIFERRLCGSWVLSDSSASPPR